jgi:hypothetical protein
MPNDSAFFDIAAALLPALMLAGLLSDKLKPPSGESPAPRWPFFLILLAGNFFVFAEVVAISAAISGEPDGFDRVVVSAALIAAALGIVVLVLLPWVENVEPRNRRRHVWGLAASVLVLGGGSVALLINAVEHAAFLEEANEQEDRARALLAEQERIYAKDARLERELSRLILRRAVLLSRPRGSDARAKGFLLGQDIRSVEAQLDDLEREEGRVFRQFAELTGEAERLFGDG